MFLEQPFCLDSGVAFNLLSDVLPGLALKREPGVSYNDFKKNKSKEMNKKSWADFRKMTIFVDTGFVFLSSQCLFFCLLT